MRIVFIRHGDPDYTTDTLTEKGRKEAALLAENIGYLGLEEALVYVSPLGRARETASYVLDKLGKTGVTLDWLREFPGMVDINGCPELLECYPDAREKDGKYFPHIPWDMVPAYWTEQNDLLDRNGWKNSEVVRHSDIQDVYEHVMKEFDDLLEEYGYVREGNHYRVEKESEATIVCVCHLGVTCAILSHLWGVSPFILWHCLFLAPTSVSEVVTEERQQGVAYFRATRLGDISHLRIGEEEPSFTARFCEVYSNMEQCH